jgi:hypothetical protein
MPMDFWRGVGGAFPLASHRGPSVENGPTMDRLTIEERRLLIFD